MKSVITITNNIQLSLNQNILYSDNNIKIFGEKNNGELYIKKEKHYVVGISGNFNITGEIKMENFHKIENSLFGSFTAFLYDKNTNKTIIKNDIFGLYPVFYYQSKGFFIVSNEYEEILPYIKLKYDHKAINFYFKYGFTPLGKTFISNLLKLKPNSILTITLNRATSKNSFINIQNKNWSYEESMKNVYNALMTAHSALYKNVNKEEDLITLSGGLDTRLNFGMIEDKKMYNYISLYTEPLNSFTDKDSIIAKKFETTYSLKINYLSFDFFHKELSIDYFKYHHEKLPQKIITGLFGGEFLSNAFFTFVSQNVIDSYKVNIKYSLSYNKHTLFSYFRFCNNSFYRFVTIILTNSFFSNFYGGTEGYWANPYKQNVLYHSIFAYPNVIKTLWQVPENILLSDDKKFHLGIVSTFFPELVEIETNSVYEKLNDYGFKYLDEGLEPKKNRINKSIVFFDEAIDSVKKMGIDYHKATDKQMIIDFYFWKSYVIKLQKGES